MSSDRIAVGLSYMLVFLFINLKSKKAGENETKFALFF